MAKQLWLLRHGEAVPHGARSDSDRELTPRGEREARAAGRALARAGIEFDACWSSPKVRARDTAAHAGEELGVAFDEVSSLAAGFDRDDALELLHAHDDGACVLVVGHEPDFSQLVHDLTGARVALEKGGVAAILLDGAAAFLLALLRPRELEAMAGGPG
ncbi:MAG TPA: phosphohistidine phosphatase SixA [Solirubrobacteraceae bacterium]|nr:phosphohistidine phosphatase SixA [Solirubrobacteraceae bacterium]